MLLYKQDGDIYFLTEVRLCIVCCRMFSRNTNSHIIGADGKGLYLFQHLVCPPEKPTPLKLERGIK